MILIFRQDKSTVCECQAIALFGVGLVGGAIVRALLRHGGTTFSELPLDWRDASQRAVDLSCLTGTLLCQLNGMRIRRLDVIWAAGKAGFGAGREELALEIGAFKEVLEWTRESSRLLLSTKLIFHMLSSAGGLFEGQRFVDRSSRPQPRRAYGEAKMEQEELVKSLRRHMDGHIYRPSSIYGFSGKAGRSGLINTLIKNAKSRSVSRIFGGLDTVRDYVLVTDIAEFIARRIIQAETHSQTFILASGRTASVTEIIQITRRVIGTPLYLRLDPQPSNASHITFRPSALPEDWRPIDLETGIRLVVRELSGSFETGAKRFGSGSLARQRGV
jgi:nucleoside-diphosphate-sugar epimerase